MTDLTWKQLSLFTDEELGLQGLQKVGPTVALVGGKCCGECTCEQSS